MTPLARGNINFPKEKAGIALYNACRLVYTIREYCQSRAKRAANGSFVLISEWERERE